MLGMVGRDAAGSALIESLQAAGADTSLIGRSDRQTGQAVIAVNDEGNNAIIVLPGANADCGAALVSAHEAEIKDSRVIMLQFEIPADAVQRAACLGKKHGRTVVVNPAPAKGPLPADLLPLIDWLTPNETELSILSGLPVNDADEAVRASRKLIAGGVRAVLATLGSRGALYVTAQTDRLFPAARVRPVDTTAAGDTFNGAFAVRLAENAGIEEAVRFANAAAGISVTRRGAQPSIPGRAEVEAFLQRSKES